jgi:hypothetical protein
MPLAILKAKAPGTLCFLPRKNGCEWGAIDIKIGQPDMRPAGRQEGRFRHFLPDFRRVRQTSSFNLRWGEMGSFNDESVWKLHTEWGLALFLATELSQFRVFDGSV